jgi:hypothetical protein
VVQAHFGQFQFQLVYAGLSDAAKTADLIVSHLYAMQSLNFGVVWYIEISFLKFFL